MVRRVLHDQFSELLLVVCGVGSLEKDEFAVTVQPRDGSCLLDPDFRAWSSIDVSTVSKGLMSVLGLQCCCPLFRYELFQ